MSLILQQISEHVNTKRNNKPQQSTKSPQCTMSDTPRSPPTCLCAAGPLLCCVLATSTARRLTSKRLEEEKRRSLATEMIRRVAGHVEKVLLHRVLVSSRFLATKSNLDVARLPRELREVMHGRKQHERVDSINENILRDRHAHIERIEDVNVPPSLVKTLRKMGFGSKRKRAGLYSGSSKGHDSKSDAGAGGHAVYVASAAMKLPLFRHLLPEIALAGHSNAGKSTMVNALSGLLPRKGIAGVSDRAGWTDQLCFYQLGKKPPVLTLVDMPGYGHAVAHKALKQLWKDMIDNYLTHRLILARCYVLVDCTRGMCVEDKKILRTLIKYDVPWKIMLTKCDLLSPGQLASSMTAVFEDAMQLAAEVKKVKQDKEVSKANREMSNTEHNAVLSSNEDMIGSIEDVSESVGHDDDESFSDEEFSDIDDDPESFLLTYDDMKSVIIPISANTGANINGLWADMLACARSSSLKHHGSNKDAVREHKKAELLRAQEIIRLNRVTTAKDGQ